MATSKVRLHSTMVSHPLDLQVSYRLGVPVVYVRGEIDHQTAPQLRAVLDEELASAPPAIIIDLSQVRYMDSGGLSLMFDTLTRIRGTGWLGLVGAVPPVARILDITGLTDQPGLRVLPTLEAAADAVRGWELASSGSPAGPPPPAAPSC
jgi:anti-sigma B factor antagonist